MVEERHAVEPLARLLEGVGGPLRVLEIIDRVPDHLLGRVAEHPVRGLVHERQRPVGVEGEDHVVGGLDEQAVLLLAGAQRVLGLLGLGHVQHHALQLQLAAVDLDHGGLVAHVHHAAVAGDHPVLGQQLVAGAGQRGLVAQHAVAVVRVDGGEPERGVLGPVEHRVAEHALDLRADEVPAALGAEPGRVHDRRHLLDQGAVALLAGLERLLRPAVLGHVLQRAHDPAPVAVDDAGPRVHDPLGAVGALDAEVHRHVRPVIDERLGPHGIDSLLVFRVDERQQRVARQLDRVRLQPEDPEQLVRPGHAPGSGLHLEAPDADHTLRMGQLGLALHLVGHHLVALGHVLARHVPAALRVADAPVHPAPAAVARLQAALEARLVAGARTGDGLLDAAAVVRMGQLVADRAAGAHDVAPGAVGEQHPTLAIEGGQQARAQLREQLGRRAVRAVSLNAGAWGRRHALSIGTARAAL